MKPDVTQSDDIYIYYVNEFRLLNKFWQRDMPSILGWHRKAMSECLLVLSIF